MAVLESANGSLLVTGGNDGVVRILDPSTGTPFANLRGHSGRITGVAILRMADGLQLVASGSSDRTVRIWSAETGKQVGHPLHGHADAIRAVAAVHLSEGQVILASAGDDGAVSLWDVRAAIRHEQHTGNPEVQSLIAIAELARTHQPRRQLVTVYSDLSVRKAYQLPWEETPFHQGWELVSLNPPPPARLTRREKQQREQERKKAEQSAAEQREQASRRRLWDESGLIEEAWHEYEAMRAHFIDRFPAEYYMRLGQYFKRREIWQMNELDGSAEKNEEEEFPSPGEKEHGLSVCRHQNDTVLLSTRDDGLVTFRRLLRGSERLVAIPTTAGNLAPPSNSARGVRLVAVIEGTEPAALLTVTNSRTIEVWSGPEHAPPMWLLSRRDREKHDPSTWPTLLRRRGVDDVVQWALAGAVEGPGAITAVAGIRRRSGGRLIAVGTSDGNVATYDLSAADPEWQTVGRHDGTITTLSTVNDAGRMLIFAGAADGTVRCWPVDGVPFGGTAARHDDAVTALCLIGTDGRGTLMVSGSLDQTVRLWNPEDGGMVSQLHVFTPVRGLSRLSRHIVGAYGDLGALAVQVV